MLAPPLTQAPWMDALAAGDRVQWQLDGQPWPPRSTWLHALAEQTQGRWRAAAAADAPQHEDRRLQWRESGAVQGSLWLGRDRLLWCDAGNRCQAVTLLREVSGPLRQDLRP